MIQADSGDGVPAAGDATSANDFAAKADSVWQALSDGDISRQDLVHVWTDVGIPVAKAIVLIVVVVFVAGWLGRVTSGIAKRARIEVTLARFFGHVVRYGVLVLGGLAILDTFGVKTTSFAAVVAAVGFSIGMAMSGTLSNVASGVMLLVFRPFKVGDSIAAGGVTGKVEELGLFFTTFDTPDNRRIVVPNSSIFGGTIENITFHSKRRVEVNVGTAYSADVDHAREVLMRAATNVHGRIAEEAPIVYLSELGQSSVNWAVRVWALTPDFWAVRERLTRDIKVALDGAGIGIPFPQMDVHLSREAD